MAETAKTAWPVNGGVDVDVDVDDEDLGLAAEVLVVGSGGRMDSEPKARPQRAERLA